MDIDIQDKIDRYLLGQMSSEEREAFEREIQQDAELKDQVEFTRNMQAAIKSRGKKLDKMALWDLEADETREHHITGRAKPRWVKLLYWTSGIAAILIAGIIFNTMIVHGPTGGPLGQVDKGLGNDGAVYRGGGDYAGIDSLLTQGRYDKALELVKAEEDKILQEMTSVSSEESGEKAEYEVLVLQGELEKLQWLEVKALLGLGDKDATKAILNQLRQSDGEYRSQADSLYNSLM
ncbi:MAG: hypothetical protein IKW85_04715 [Muribaculaceae bacterium]|nr:hypothetical protein [Muribaculaceae bacterium]